MEELPESVRAEIQNYEVTLEPGHLTLIVITVGGDLHTYTFVEEKGSLTLESQTENGAKTDVGVSNEIEMLLLEHPLLTPELIND